MIKFIDNNSELYKPDKDSYLKSLSYAKNLKETDCKMVFHCFWRVPKDFSRKHLAVLKSIIVNHDINNLVINLWSNVDLRNNIYFKEVERYVTFRHWDYSEEIKGTILENASNLNKDTIYDDLCYLEGDLFRLLILHKYGGFYLDMDVLVLRNMTFLNNYEFLYQWGTSGFNSKEPVLTMNGAIMKLDKNSKLSFEFMEKLISTPFVKNYTSWGNQLYSKIVNNDLLVLPGVWFNSEWGFEDTVNNPFKKLNNIELFDGAFTWHWHNRWNDEIEIGSKFYIIEQDINKKFDKIKLLNFTSL